MSRRSPGSIFTANFDGGLDPEISLRLRAVHYPPRSEVVDTVPQPKYKKVFTSGNRLKAALRDCDEDTLRQVAKVNGIWKDSYKKLSGGLLRMTVGNQLQMKLDACQPVVIGKIKL